MRNLAIMGLLLILGLVMLADKAKAMDAESATQLLEIHTQTFSDKETQSNRELCVYHNELVESSKNSQKTKMECPRNEGSKTKDEDLQVQLQQIEYLQAVTQEDDSIDSVVDHAIAKMKYDFRIKGN